jgi:predicted Zn-dependent protease
MSELGIQYSTESVISAQGNKIKQPTETTSKWVHVRYLSDKDFKVTFTN